MKHPSIDKNAATNNREKSVNRPSVMNSRLIILTAVVLIIVGYFFMSGSGNTAQSFNPGIFSTLRIEIAPLFCLSGYLLIIVGILRKNS